MIQIKSELTGLKNVHYNLNKKYTEGKYFGTEFGSWVVEWSPMETTRSQPKLRTVISATLFLAAFVSPTSGPFLSINIPAHHPLQIY